MKNKRYTFALTVTSILFGITFSLLIGTVRTGLEEVVKPSDLFSICMLLVLLVITPDIVKPMFNLKDKWYTSSESITVILLVTLTATGFFIESDFVLSFLKSVISILAIVSIIYVLINKKVEKSFRFTTVFVFLAAFLTVFSYAEGYISMLFFEQVILGMVHRDTMYHMSISEILQSMKLVSTGLHGAEMMNYHWGSHLIYSSLANILELDAMVIYNYGSPLIFIPLIIKHTVQFLNALSFKLGLNEINPFLLCLIIPLLFSAGLFYGSLLGGSTGLATLLVLIHATISITYHDEASTTSWPYIIFTLLIFIAILFCKISTFFVYVPAYIFAYIKLGRSISSIVHAIIVIGITFFLTVNYVYPFEVSESGLLSSLTLKPLLFYVLTRFESIFTGSLNPILNFLPILIAIVYYFKLSTTSFFQSIITSFKDNSSILIEMLVVMNILAFLPGLILDLKPVDIYYFRHIHVFLSICLLVVYLNSFLEKRMFKNRMLLFLIIPIVILPISKISGGYELYFGSRGIKEVKAQINTLTDEQKLLENLLIQLRELRDGSCDNMTAVYIPNDENWYFLSQNYRSEAANFIVQGLSGCVMIGGITETNIRNARKDYSFGYYNSIPDLPILSLEEAKSAAIRRGFANLIVFENEGNELKSTLIHLR